MRLRAAPVRKVGQALRGDLGRTCADHGERDREVERRSLLPLRGRSQIDRDSAAGPPALRRAHTAPHPVLRLLAGAVGQPHDREARDSVEHLGLDLDPAGLEADERMRERASEHVATIGNRGLHVCAGSAPDQRQRKTTAPERALPDGRESGKRHASRVNRRAQLAAVRRERATG